MIALFITVSLASLSIEAARVGLGGRCKSDSDCQIAYSACVRGICACRPSFQAQNGLCKTENFCPHVSNKKRSIGKGYCIIDGYDTTQQQHTGNCGFGSFCFLHPDTYSPSGQRIGVCCPKVDSTANMVCPQGDIAIKNAECPNKVTALADGANLDSCSSRSTQCVDWKNKNVCCTKPCPNSLFNIGGRCYEHVTVGEACDYDYQCPENGKCMSSKGKTGKTCQCPNGDDGGVFCL